MTNYTGPNVSRMVPHVYLSTACLHGIHSHCHAITNLQGEPKLPATCKWCTAPCTCDCHTRIPAPHQQHIRDRLEALVDQALAQHEQGYLVDVQHEITELTRLIGQSS